MENSPTPVGTEFHDVIGTPTPEYSAIHRIGNSVLGNMDGNIAKLFIDIGLDCIDDFVIVSRDLDEFKSFITEPFKWDGD